MTRIEHTKFWRVVPQILQWVIILTATVTTLIVFIETCFRVFDFLNFNGYEEILIMAAFWLYMIGCAHGSYEKSQITADIAEAMMKETLRKDIMRVVREILTVVLGLWFLYWGWNLILYALDIGTVTSVYRIPMVIGYSSIFTGLVFIILFMQSAPARPYIYGESSI